jgi:anti-sigma factor RsiW
MTQTNGPMEICEFNSRLDAFHDRELDHAAAAQVAEHVKRCPACAEALAQLQRVSGLFANDREDSAAAEVSAAELLPIHAAVDREIAARPASTVDRSFWRTAGMLGALAASVLIIASAWLWETPVPHQSIGTVASAGPAWERVATTLEVDPLPQVNADPLVDRSALADAHGDLTDWMLANLKGAHP